MVPMTACRLAEPSTGRTRERGSSIGGKPLTKRRAGKLVSVSNIRQEPPWRIGSQPQPYLRPVPAWLAPYGIPLNWIYEGKMANLPPHIRVKIREVRDRDA
jgi:hypothetical protein